MKKREDSHGLFGVLSAMLASALTLAAAPAQSQEPDWDPYAQVLSQYLHPGTNKGIDLVQVDYAGLKANGLIERLAEQLAKFDPAQLSNRKERLAFYINAYNILAIKMVLDHWPVESIKDVGSLFNPVWKKPAGELGGDEVSLDEIEHAILRPLGEPRVHFAIVCASLSCPDLRQEPYTAARLESQLEDQARRFLGNESKGLRIESERIRISKIFDWFEEDFDRLGGAEGFIRRYRPDLPKRLVRADIPYDWDLNVAPPVSSERKPVPAPLISSSR
jgi:hypothetical protein